MIKYELDNNPHTVKSFLVDDKYKYLSPYFCMLYQYHITHHNQHINFATTDGIKMAIKLRKNMEPWLIDNQNTYMSNNLYTHSLLKNIIILTENMTLYDYISDTTNTHYVDLFLLHKMFNISVVTYNFNLNKNVFLYDKYHTHLIDEHKQLSFEQLLSHDNVYVMLYNPSSKLFSLYTIHTYQKQNGGGANGEYDLNILSKSQIRLFRETIFPLVTRLYVENGNTKDPNEIKILNGTPDFTHFELTTHDFPHLINESIAHDIKYRNVLKFTNQQHSYILYIVSNTSRIQDIEQIGDIKYLVLYYKSIPLSIVNTFELTKKMSFVRGQHIHNIALSYPSFNTMIENITNGLTVGDCKYSLDAHNLYIEGIGELGKTNTPKERNFEIKIVKLVIETDTYIEKDLNDVYFDFTRLLVFLNLGDETIKYELLKAK